MANIFNIQGVGGLVFILIVGIFIVGYYLTLKWIKKAGNLRDRDKK